MATIEERAKEYASKKADISLSDIYNEALASIYEESYVAGATEQKKIDIKKASEWFKRNAEKFFEVSIKYGDTSIELSRKFFDDFRKAMEE